MDAAGALALALEDLGDSATGAGAGALEPFFFFLEDVAGFFFFLAGAGAGASVGLVGAAAGVSGTGAGGAATGA